MRLLLELLLLLLLNVPSPLVCVRRLGVEWRRCLLLLDKGLIVHKRGVGTGLLRLLHHTSSAWTHTTTAACSPNSVW